MSYKGDDNAWRETEMSDPADEWVLIAPSDAVDLSPQPKALYVGVTGNVKCRDKNGNDVVFQNAQGMLPIRPVRIWSTGTTATGIVGIY